ncbi:MAG TPA: helix-turn-helix domain-containing protein [Solirubrobacteraceae bacterium]|jgi:excisionase family DNA binding protein
MPELLTPTEVAQLLRITPRTVNRYAVDGRLQRVKIGERLSRYRREDVLALIDPENSDAPVHQTEATPKPGSQLPCNSLTGRRT